MDRGRERKKKRESVRGWETGRETKKKKRMRKIKRK